VVSIGFVGPIDPKGIHPTARLVVEDDISLVGRFAALLAEGGRVDRIRGMGKEDEDCGKKQKQRQSAAAMIPERVWEGGGGGGGLHVCVGIGYRCVFVL
jgi:hypothetical protein